MRQAEFSQIAFRIDKVLAKEFKSECALQEESIQTVLTRAIKEYIARNKAERNPE